MILDRFRTAWKRFRYLGYDRRTIESCTMGLCEDNVDILCSVSHLLSYLIVSLIAFYLVFDNLPLRNLICGFSFAVMITIYIISSCIRKKKLVCSACRVDVMTDIFITLCFLVGIYLGTFAAGDEMAVAPVWMFFFAVLIFNRLPLRNVILLSSALAVFIICSSVTKSQRIFQYDVMHAVASAFTCAIMSWQKSRMKVENILSLEKLRMLNSEIMETVEEQERETKLLRHKASRDELTGLYKKNTFREMVKRILENSSSECRHAFACMDIDNFKGINDHLGHMQGDFVLKSIAQIIVDQIGEKNISSRFGGDEFCIFFPEITSVEAVERHVQNILQKCRREYNRDGTIHHVSISIGVAFYPDCGTRYDALFCKADDALYAAKHHGKNSCMLFETNTNYPRKCQEIN